MIKAIFYQLLQLLFNHLQFLKVHENQNKYPYRVKSLAL